MSDQMRDALEDALESYRTPPPGWPHEWDESRRPKGWTAAKEQAALTALATREHTWRGQDLIALGNAKPEPPAIGGLVYPGRRHVLSGEAEAGKSWLALALAADELRQGRGVVWVDADDMGPSAVLERLRALGVDDEIARVHFAYLRPSEPLSEEAGQHVALLLTELSSRLLVYDAFNPALALHGCDPNSTPDIERFFREAVDPFRKLGAAVLLPDHVVKNKENRGKYAYGSERKQTGVDVHIGLTAIEPFGRGRTGKAKLTVHKDRPGFLERPSPGLFMLASDEEDGRCAWHIEPDHSIGEDGRKRPTVLMERVSRYLEVAGEPRSRNQIEKDVKGSNPGKRWAIDVLVAEGYAVEVPQGQTRLVKLERAFRESDEWESA